MAKLLTNTRVYGNTTIDDILTVGGVNSYPSISNTTGTLIVNGGLGVSGNIYATTVYSNGVSVFRHANAAFNAANSATTGYSSEAILYTDVGGNIVKSGIGLGYVEADQLATIPNLYVYDTTTTWGLQVSGSAIISGAQLQVSQKLNLSGGTTTYPPLQIGASNQQLITPQQGAIEFSNSIFLSTPNTKQGLIPSTLYYRNASSNTLGGTTVAQSITNTRTGITVEANTLYEIEGGFFMTTTGTTSHTEALRIDGTATYWQVSYYAQRANASTTSGTTAFSNVISSWITTNGAFVMTPAITIAANSAYRFQGHLAVRTGGTISPCIQFSANPGGTSRIANGAWIKITTLGLSQNTDTNITGWA